MLTDMKYGRITERGMLGSGMEMRKGCGRICVAMVG